MSLERTESGTFLDRSLGSGQVTAVEVGPFRVCAESVRTRVWAVPESYPAAVAAAEGALADALLPEFEKILGVDLSEMVDVVLVEPVPNVDVANHERKSTSPAIVRIVGSDGAGPPLSWLLGQYAAASAVSGPVRHRAIFGLALLAESRVGLAPPIEIIEADISRDEDPLGSPAGWASLATFTFDRLGPSGMVVLLQRPRDEPEALEEGSTPALDVLVEPWLRFLRSRTAEMRGWRRMVSHLRPIARPYRWRLFELLTYMVLALVFTIGLPLASSYLVDSVLPSGSTRLLVIFIVVLAVISVYNAALGIRADYANAEVNLQIFRRLQLQMFSNLQRLSHDYYGRSRVGDIMSRMSTDLALVQQTAGLVLGGTVSAALTFVAAVIAISALSPYIGLSVLVVLPLIALAYRIYGRQLAVASLAMQEQIGDTQSYLQQSLQAQEVTKAFRAEARTVRSFGERVTSQSVAALRLTLLGGKMGASISLANGLPQLAIMGIGGYLVMTGRLSLGVLVALLGLIPSVFSPITSLSEIAQAVRQTTGAMHRVVELLGENPSVVDTPGASVAPRCTRSVRFSNVSFAYPTGRLVLDDITLEIPAGSRVAIVGPSGCGKSTLLSLLARFWDPTSGAVEIDNDDVRKFSLSSLRSQVGLVLQDTFVFDDSLRANVSIGKPDATDDEILRALDEAELNDFFEALPHGLETRMGEQTRASGGQRQRLAFARILLLDPSILALDEPTSALDSQTERALLGTMAAVAGGRTTIMVTHRLAAAVDADLIVVMESGRVVESGTHSELMAADGAYVRLYASQENSGPRTVEMIQTDALKRSALFESATPEILYELAAALEPEQFGEGDEIVRAGDTGDRLYLVANGELDVLIDDDQIGRQTVRRLRHGDLFGELAVLGAGERTATVRATTPVLLWGLSADAMANISHRYPDLRVGVEQGLADRVAVYQFAKSADFRGGDSS